MTETMPTLLTADRAASIIGCHVETIRRAIRSGKLAAYRRRGCTRISEIDLKAYLDTYHCPVNEMTDLTLNSIAENGRSSGGSKGNVRDALRVARMKRPHASF